MQRRVALAVVSGVPTSRSETRQASECMHTYPDFDFNEISTNTPIFANAHVPRPRGTAVSAETRTKSDTMTADSHITHKTLEKSDAGFQNNDGWAFEQCHSGREEKCSHFISKRSVQR